MNNEPVVRIGTRGSPLALVQAEMTKAALIAADPALAEEGAVEIEVIKTKGDHILDRPLSEVGGKGLFTKEIEERLQSGAITIAVHSMKDMATNPPEDLVIAAMLARADPRDALISSKAATIADLPHGAHVGTASLRRAAQIKAMRPDIQISTLRGSVQTRLDKVGRGEFDATLLAKAGLDRLGLTDAARQPIDPGIMLPAVAQAAVGIQCRRSDGAARERLSKLDHAVTHQTVEIERGFLAVLDGSCRTPIAGHARVLESGRIEFAGLVAKPDGSEVHKDRHETGAADAAQAARELGMRFKDMIGPDYFTV